MKNADIFVSASKLIEYMDCCIPKTEGDDKGCGCCPYAGECMSGNTSSIVMHERAVMDIYNLLTDLASRLKGGAKI